MRKIKLLAFSAMLATTAVLIACSSENTTGVDAGNTNTENQSNMDTQNNMDTTNTGTMQDTSYQNPPTDESGGTRDQ